MDWQFLKFIASIVPTIEVSSTFYESAWASILTIWNIRWIALPRRRCNVMTPAGTGKKASVQCQDLTA